MKLSDVQKALEGWSPDEQDRLAAFLSVLRRKRNPAHAKEMARRLEDRTPGHWLTLCDLEKAFPNG